MARSARRQRSHPVLGFAVLALAVGASLVLPVSGTVMVAALLTLLRTGYLARTGLAGRRRLRGPRLWDPALVVWSIPWMLARSAIQTVLLGPVLLAAAVEAVAVTTTPLPGVHAPSAWAVAATTSLHGVHLPSAWSAVAAVYTALSCLGSRAARRELHRVLDAFTSSPLEMVMTVLILGAIAMMIAALALIQPSSMWPLPDPLIIHTRIPGLHLVRLNA